LAFKSCDLEFSEAVNMDRKVGGVSGTAIMIYLEIMSPDSEKFTNNLCKILVGFEKCTSAVPNYGFTTLRNSSIQIRYTKYLESCFYCLDI
jgi:hypothetical protein